MSGLRVLQITPSPTVDEKTVERLEQRGHDVRVETAGDANAGLTLLQDAHFDCVVFPLALPDMDTIAFLERVQATDPDRPTIAVSGQGESERLDAALSAGVTEFVDQRGPADYHTVLAKRIHDAVERVRVTEELEEEQRFVDQLFEHVPVSLYVKDEGGRHVRLSGFYGVDPDVAKGKTDRELYPYMGESSYRDDMKVIQTGEPILNQVEHLPKEDEWNMTSKAPWYGEDGEIKGLIGVTWLITEQKEYEQELRKQNERLDKFARIVSHELRNPLQVARGRAEILKEERENEHANEVVAALDQMSELITNLLALARGTQRVDGGVPVSLTDVVEKCWNMVDSGEATLVTEREATIRADRAQLEHLLENLFKNAIDHGGENVTVTVGLDERGEGFFVADDGPGIPENDREEVFDVGYSAAGERTGYGLRIVAEVAATHGWEIDIRSSEDGGARFDITNVEFTE